MSPELESVLVELLPVVPVDALVVGPLVSLVEVLSVFPEPPVPPVLVPVPPALVPVPPVVGLTGLTALEVPVPPVVTGAVVLDPVGLDVVPVTVLSDEGPLVESVDVPGSGDALVHVAKASPDRSGRSGETRSLVLLVMAPLSVLGWLSCDWGRS